jgi:hypothetical protein
MRKTRFSVNGLYLIKEKPFSWAPVRKVCISIPQLGFELHISDLTRTETLFSGALRGRHGLVFRLSQRERQDRAHGTLFA